MQSSKTIIKVADVETGQMKVILRGHYDLIHDLDFTQDDNYLISASADGSCIVWDITRGVRTMAFFEGNVFNYVQFVHHLVNYVRFGR